MEDNNKQLKLWPLVALIIFLLAGIGISFYLVRHHEMDIYGKEKVELANCPKTETINCDVVNTSPYSEILGIPIALFGLITYIMLLILLFLGYKYYFRVFAYAFLLGLFAVAYSLFLFVISYFKIGFLCTWCMQLYFINCTIPVFIFLAAKKGVKEMLREILVDLKTRPRELKASAIILLILSILTLGAHRIYRNILIDNAKKHPRAGKTVNLEDALSKSTLSRLIYKDKRLKEDSFDLQDIIGKDHPVALIFWHPNVNYSKSVLISMVRYFRENAPEYRVYAISGWKSDSKTAMLWETFAILGISSNVPLLADKEYTLSKELNIQDVPNVALIDKKGSLITTGIKSLSQVITYAPEKLTSEDIIKKVALGADVKPIIHVPPYYPSSELFGKCAPSFSLKDFMTGREYNFNGRSTTKPTFLIFWSATCKHCQIEVPAFIKNANSRPGEYDIISVTHFKPDKPGKMSYKEITRKYAERIGFKWPILDDEDVAVNDLYGIVSTPTTFVISPGGKILEAWYYVHSNFDEVMDKTLTKIKRESTVCQDAGIENLPAANFDITDIENKKVKLADIIDRPSIVHFWATWCVSCKAEFPLLYKFQQDTEKQGIKFIYISIEDSGKGDLIKQYERDNKMSLKSYRAPEGGIAESMDMAYSVPRTYLALKGGRIVKILYGTQEWKDPVFREKILSRLKNSR